jgi:hypothetical protein
MRSSREHVPYPLYKKKTKSGLYWHVRFRDEKTQAYNTVRSTGIPVEGKRERRRETDNAAKTFLAELRQETAQPEAGQNGMIIPAESMAAGLVIYFV